ncbi:MAG: hemolysin family protein [Candidatus Zixiibacteriota bacterium]
MDNRVYLEIAAIVFLILGNGFFALAEFSIIASRKTRLRQKKADNKWGAAAALKLHDNPESFLASIQVGITLVAALVGVFSGATLVDRFRDFLAISSVEFFSRFASPIAVGTVVVGITVLSSLMGELVPKYIALSNPEKFARLTAKPITLFVKASYVFSQFLSSLAKMVLKVLGIKATMLQGVATEEEIQHLIVEGREKGMFDVTEEEFVKSVFEFTDTTVRRAMKPRPDVIALDITDTPDVHAKTIVEGGYSRYPVFEGTIDSVIGVVYVKDLIKERVDMDKLDIRKIMRPPLFVPDTMQLTRLLRDFQTGKNHLAVVLDEYGGTAGIITLEDILEELVGEIQDEYDSEAPPLVKQSATVAFADGSVWPGDVNDLLGAHLPLDVSETLAGIFIEKVGRMPEKYENAQVADIRMTILSKDKNRILRVKLEKNLFPEQSEE